MMFQSAPGFSAGRNSRCAHRSHERSRFNPLPAFRPGETRDHRSRHRRGEVSIRSRLFGREKRHCFRPKRNIKQSFNPLPAFRPGETQPSGCMPRAGQCFNPLPAFRPGETRSPASQPRCETRFNPLPAFRPGETSRYPLTRPVRLVSIRSRLFGREKHNRKIKPPRYYDVSIRSRLFGREKLSMRPPIS